MRQEEAAARALSRNPYVGYVEDDGLASTTVTQLNPPSWGLDRIDQRALPLNNACAYASNITGEGVNAYVIDTGIRPTHVDFGGRAFLAANRASYGVAKGVRIHAVRAFGCGDTTLVSTVIAGVDWVTADHVEPAVANMSLGTHAPNPDALALDAAVKNSITSGVTYVIAAGNNLSAGAGMPPRSSSRTRTTARSTSTSRSQQGWHRRLSIGRPITPVQAASRRTLCGGRPSLERRSRVSLTGRCR